MLSARGEAPSYLLTVPPAAVALSARAFDLFNAANSNLLLRMLGLWAIPASDVAVTGLVSARYDVHRTSAVGTAGTAATYKGTPTTAPTINPLDSNNPALPAQVTARAVPTGGATSAGWLFPVYVATEETAPGAHLAQMFNLMLQPPSAQDVSLRPGEGLLVQQGAVASVGSVGWLLQFATMPLVT
jgi:hypothetical protein